MRDGLRPRWATTLRAERESRQWSKPELARRLYRAKGLSGTSAMISSLVRQIRGWENGEHYPRDWAAAYAAAFDVSQASLFGREDEEDSDTNRRDALRLGIASVTPAVLSRRVRDAALDAMEFTRRASTTAVGAAAFGQLDAAVADLSRAYTLEPPDELFGVARGYRARVAEMASGPCTLREKRELYVHAAWLSELLAWLSHDLGNPMAAESWAVDSFQHAEQAGHEELCAWAMDAMASVAMYAGRPTRAVAAARAGIVKAPPGHPLAIRLRAQAARAHARLGQREECERLLGEAADLHGELPARTPTRFGVDTATLAVYAVTAYAASSYIWLGGPRDLKRAKAHAQAAVTAHEAAPPAERSPSREAIARLDLGIALAGLGAPDEAAALGRQALATPRLVGSVLSRADDLNQALTARHADVAAARDFREAYLVASGQAPTRTRG